MSDEEIEVPVLFPGLLQATQAWEELAGTVNQTADVLQSFGTAVSNTIGGQMRRVLGAAEDTVTELAESFNELSEAGMETARTIGDLGDKFGFAGRSVTMFGQAIQSEAVTAMGELINQTGDSIEMFSRFGAILGPQGAIVGGLVGAVIPALTSYITATERASEAQHQAFLTAREEQRALDDLTNSIREADAARREGHERMRGRSGGQEDVESGEQAVQSLERQIQRLERLRDSSGVDVSERVEQLREQIRQQQLLVTGAQIAVEEARELQQWQDNVAAATAAAERAAEAAAQSAEEYAEAQAALQERLMANYEAQAAEAERLNAIEQRRLDLLAEEAALRDRLREENDEKERESWMGRVARQREEEQRARDVEEERIRAWHENDEREREGMERRVAYSRERTAELAEIVGSTVNLFKDAVTATIAGTMSAEDAFKGMLKGFLEMISEQAMTKALFEFAEGIAAFARQDYAAGGQHIAAGILYTGVAIATGVGAAALAPPPTPAPEPAEREQSSSGGGDVVVNINSPVVSAATHAQLGRMLRQQIGRADRMGL